MPSSTALFDLDAICPYFVALVIDASFLIGQGVSGWDETSRASGRKRPGLMILILLYALTLYPNPSGTLILTLNLYIILACVSIGH